MAYIELKNVTRVYGGGGGEIRALDGVDFQVERGELCVIVGPSGAGKTTVLNLLGAALWARGALTGCAGFALGIGLAVVYDRKIVKKQKNEYIITGYAGESLLKAERKGDNGLD